MNWLISYGLRRFFSGSRLGQPWMAGLGAAMTLVGWLRSRRDSDEVLVYKRVLREGETIRVRLRRGDAVVDETDIAGSPTRAKG